MKKIATFISEVDQITKRAFIPAPQQGGGQDPTSGGQPQQGQSPQGGQGQGGGVDPQVQQMLQQLPPEVQQQVAQQLQQLPPEQQAQAMQQVMQQLQGGQQQQQQPQQPAGPGQPQAQGGQVTPAGQEPLPPGHLQAENDLDNTKVQLSVRELMDLTSGGKATQSHLKVKQLVDGHNQKMQQAKQQAEQQAVQRQAEQQVAAQGMQSGGLYAQAPDMSGKSSQQPGAAPQQAAPMQQ